MFVDASALAAILLDEPEGMELAGAIESTSPSARITSPIAVFEASLAVNRTEAEGIERAERIVLSLLKRSSIAIAPVDQATSALAIAAHARFGKGSGHPARLNLGDCFAYAMAKQHGVPLLYKGEDFSHTDLA